VRWFFNKIERFRLSALFSRVTFLDQITVLETLMRDGFMIAGIWLHLEAQINLSEPERFEAHGRRSKYAC